MKTPLHYYLRFVKTGRDSTWYQPASDAMCEDILSRVGDGRATDVLVSPYEYNILHKAWRDLEPEDTHRCLLLWPKKGFSNCENMPAHDPSLPGGRYMDVQSLLRYATELHLTGPFNGQG
jgi:hypothetical protein